MKAIYPGSFDPITYGHLDIIKQAAELFDELVVAVGVNEKKAGLFFPRCRRDLICLALASPELFPKEDYPITVETFSGLIVDYAIKTGANALVRGLRSVTDFEFEFQFAMACRSMCPQLQVVYLMTSPEHLFVSSSLVKEIAENAVNGTLEQRIGKMVPPPVIAALAEQLRCGIY